MYQKKIFPIHTCSQHGTKVHIYEKFLSTILGDMVAKLEKDVIHFICRKLENLVGFGHQVVIPCHHNIFFCHLSFQVSLISSDSFVLLVDR